MTDYTPVDHAVWRFHHAARTFFPEGVRAQSLFPGVCSYRHSFERIPRIQEMNDILAKIEWGAVAVDGFNSAGGVHGIPSLTRSSSSRATCGKSITLNTRRRRTFVQEAAGHAPIIVDREYSRYLQRFGEVGRRRCRRRKISASTKRSDPSILEGSNRTAIRRQVEEATKLVEHRQKTLGEPSEMALLSLLALVDGDTDIGALENPKNYGAIAVIDWRNRFRA